MKYFTPELILRTRSHNDDIADAASEEWDRLQETCLNRLRDINPKLPRSLRSLLKRFYLHDAKICTIALDEGSTLSLTLQLDGHDNGGLQLTYRLTAPLKFYHHPKIAEPGTSLEWLYDEVDLVEGEPGIIQHNILLTQGIELELRFRSLSVKRFKRMLSPNSQQLIDSTRELKLLTTGWWIFCARSARRALNFYLTSTMYK